MSNSASVRLPRTDRTLSGWRGYAVAIVAVAVATLARLALNKPLGESYPFPTYFGAVAAVALMGRTRHSTFALILGGLVCSYLFLPPRYSLFPVEPSVFTGLALFFTVGGLMVVMGHTRRVALQQSEQLLTEAVVHRDELQKVAASESEYRERLRITLASIGDAVISTDREGNVIYLNAVAETLTGWGNGEAAGQPLTRVLRIVNEVTREPIDNPALRALKEGATTGLEDHAILVAKDSTERPIDDSAAPIRNQAGEIVGSVLVFRDVSERRAGELARAERLRLVALRADVWGGIAAARTLPDGLARCCEAVVKHLGVAFARVWTHDQLTGWLELQASAGLYTHLNGPHSRIRVGEFKIGRIAAARTPLLTNNVQHDPNVSDPEWAVREGMVAFAGYPLVCDGRLVGVLAAFARQPLTASVLTDLAPLADQLAQFVTLRTTFREVEVAEQRYRALASTAPVGIFETDATGNCTFVNDRWCQLAGLTPSLAAGQGWVAALHPDDRERVFSEWYAAATEGRDFHLEYRFRSPAGRTSWLIGGASSLRGRDGTITGYIGTVTDMTVRKELEVEREQLVGQLRASDRRKDEFLATLAHELRNPLAPMRNGLQLIRMLGESSKVEQVRSMMDRQLTQLVRLVDDLLDISRLASGKLELRRERVAVKVVIDAAVETSRLAIERAGHELVVLQVDESILVDGDVTRLAQVVSNLLNNSAKYTHRGGHIKLAVRREGDTAVLSVRDDGIGIPPAMLVKVFELFTQVDRTLEKTTGGLGIGLSLVRGLVEMHGGTVEARSEGEGQGSEFLVRLPLATPAGGSDRAGALAEESVPSARRRVLVVDDNADAVESLAELLELLGNEVRTASDGEAGVRAAEDFRPEVVFMDIAMPKLNGYAAARRIREQPWGKSMTLIALTGWGNQDDRRKTAEAGFDHHLIKPVEYAALTKLLVGEEQPGSKQSK